MPRLGITVEHQQHAITGRRMARLYAITDPLWHAIAHQHSQEIARLMIDLKALIEQDRRRSC